MSAGFDHVFNSPFDRNDERNGTRCRITKTLLVPSLIEGEPLATMYVIVFEDGEEMGAWEDEVSEA